MTAYPIPPEALKESVAIIGRTGSGKTFAAKGAVELLLREGARVCIIDPTSVWWGLRSSADGKRAGLPVVVFGGDHGDVATNEHSGQPLATLIAGQNLPAIIDVAEFTMGGRVRFMTAFLENLYRLNKTPLTLVIDEADLFAPQRAMPDQTVMLSRMEQIVRRGRVRGFRPWLITQRPAELHKSVLSQANTLVAMQLTAPQDRDAVGAWIEGQADRVKGKEILADLARLKKGEGWVWSPTHDVLARVRFPAITTYDSGRSPEEGEIAGPTKLAEVDLSAIGESLRVAEAEIADNDPKVLRARIKELERTVASGPAVGADALERERRAGKIEGYKAAIDGLVPMVDRMRTLRLALDEQLGGMIEDLDRWRARQAAQVPEIEATKTAPRAEIVKHSGQIHAPRQVAGSGTNGSMPKAERLILTALAQYPQGRSSVQVALLTAYAHGGGGFRNAVGALRTKGYAVGSNEHLIATPEGIKALGSFERLPTGPALLDHWYRQLSKAERKILESLAEVYPRSLTPAQIANRAGYEVGGGGFRNALGRLRTLELAHGRAELKASADLFE